MDGAAPTTNEQGEAPKEMDVIGSNEQDLGREPSQQDERRKEGGRFKTQPCRFFQTDSCKKGDQCTYLHEKSGAPPRERRMEGDWHTGDWECRKCKGHNFSKRTTCFKCDTEGGPSERRGGPPPRGVRQAEDELRDAENLLKTAQGEANPNSISAAEEAIGRARMALKRARDRDMDHSRDRRGPPPRDYRRPRSRSPPRYGFRDRSPPRGYRERSPSRSYREHWDRPERGERGWGPNGEPSWRDSHGPPPHHPNGSSHVPPLPGSRPYGAPPPLDVSQQPPPVQGRWEEALAENGDKYYWNTLTKETRWTDPRVPVAPVAPPPPAPAPASTWDVTVDQHGDKYYWNTATGETSWEKPPGFVEKRPTASAGPPTSAAVRPQQYSQQYPPAVKGPPQPLRGIRRLG